MERRPSDWINTFTGKKMWPLDPDPRDISIIDIAHALSLQCRFSGHVRKFYSVAEHSLRVSFKVPEEDALWGLLHDAAEAYLMDMARPVKHHPAMQAYRDAEEKIMKAVCEHFQLPLEQPESVTRADGLLVITEAKSLMEMHPDWSINWSHLGEGYDERIVPLSPIDAEVAFLKRYIHLEKRRA